MPATYEPITTTTLGSTATTITLSSLPTTYTDLKLIYVGSANDTPWLELRFNGATSGYSNTEIWGDGSTVTAHRGSGASTMLVGYPLNSSTIPSLAEIDIFDYRGSNYKNVLSKLSSDLNGTGNVWRSVGLYASTSTITSITLIAPGGGTFYAGAQVSLYGIKAA